MSDPPTPPIPYRNPMLELRAHCKPLIDSLYTAIKFYSCSGSKDISLFIQPLVDLNSIIARYNYPVPSRATNLIKDYLIHVRDAVREVIEDRSEGGMEWQLENLKKWLNVLSGENR